LRKAVAILILCLAAALGPFAPVVAAAVPPAQPKVVIIVGATHAVTPTYRAYADLAYTEARKYTTNVVKVYSPNATWAAVKAATVGANVVIYMGHGNGWPSPYTYDPAYTTKDGFGLNATAGAGDYNNKYYGEPSVATLDLAPDAIVLLHHLCYAAGNSEPGLAEPSVSVAHQRLDNYAAGFLKAGASAVIADGHRGPVDYLRALFTTHQTIEQLWRTQPNVNGHIVTFNSARTPGATAFSDPDTATTGFYRSLVGDRTVTTDDILGGAYNDTSGDPAGLVVDTAPPHLATVTPDAATVPWFSPNGDGNRDTVALGATNSETGSLSVRIRNAAGDLVRKSSIANGTGPTTVTWDGRATSGSVVPDGDYIIRISPIDSVGNTGTAVERTVRVIGALRSVATSRALFYPQDLDNLAKTTKLSFVLARPMTVTWTLSDATGAVVVTHLDAVDLPAGSQAWVFDGRRSDGTMLPTGHYVSYVVATDGTFTASQSVAFDAQAFVLNPSDTTPGRGQLVTVRATTAESLSAAPRLYITQPGKATWSVPMTRTSGSTYAATVRLKTGGHSGTVSFQVRGKDSNGVMQRTTKSYPLH
jgi:hypothetical protein